MKARLALLAGKRDRARIALKSALRHNPNSFVAHFLLGRIYMEERSSLKARREFDLAWQIDPERFERSYGRLKSQRERVPDLFGQEEADEGGAVATEVEDRGYRVYWSETERARLVALPPITTDEIARIDWDELEDDLFAE